jgi:hypothetical protein
VARIDAENIESRGCQHLFAVSDCRQISTEPTRSGPVITMALASDMPEARALAVFNALWNRLRFNRTAIVS